MTDANIKYSNRQRYVGIKNTQMQNLRVHVKNKNCLVRILANNQAFYNLKQNL